jgi:hypothetical protein
MTRSSSRFVWAGEWAEQYDCVRQRPVEASSEDAHKLCQQALEITDRLDAELWISSILGQWWSQAEELRPWDEPGEAQPDLDFLVAGPPIRQLAAVGGPGAWAVLHAVSVFHTGRAARLAGDLADTLDTFDFDRPSWTRYLGERSAVSELIQQRPNGAAVIAIELRHVLDEPRWLVVFNAAHSIRKTIDLCRSFGEVEEFARTVARKNAKVLPFVEMSSGHGCYLARQAIVGAYWRSEARFAELRAWALTMTKPPSARLDAGPATTWSA